MGNELYERYEKLRDIKGYTDYKVAKLAGIKGTATISNWKNGKYTPKDDKMQAIASVLDVTFDYLKGNTDMVVCPVCGFGDNPLSEQSRKEHETFHNYFLTVKKQFPQYMPYAEADKLRSQCISILRDINTTNEEKIDAFDLYLKAAFSLELSRTDYDELEYVDYERFCMYEVGNATAGGYINAELRDILIEKYGVSYNFADIYYSDDAIIERTRNNTQLMRILAYAEKLNPGMLDTIEIQLKALAEQNPKE